MIVVDTNIIAYLFLSSGPSPLADEALQIDSDWTAPVLWRSEFRNILAAHLRKGLLSLEDAGAVMEAAEERMREGEFEVTSVQVLGLVNESTCSAYDCEFVALARALGVRLVTVDREILRAFPEVAVSLAEFVGK